MARASWHHPFTVFIVAVAATALCCAGTVVSESARCQQYFQEDDRVIDDSINPWDSRKEGEGITVLTRGNMWTEFVTFKMFSEFEPRALPELTDVLYTHNVERNGDWSKSFLGGNIVKVVEPGVEDVLYMKYDAPWPITKRDFCYVRCRRPLPNGGTMMAFRSVDDSECPGDPSFLRGYMLDCAERISVGDDGTVVVTYILKTDTAGWLPKFTSNWANIDVMFKEFKDLHSLVEK